MPTPDQYQHKPTLRVLDIVDALAKSKNGLTLSQLSDSMGCPKSTLTPILKTMTSRNYLVRDTESQVYNIGKQAFLIGSVYQDTNDVLSLIQDQMNQLSSDCDETCHFGILSGQSILYLLKVTAPKPIQLISSVGKKLPAYATALGKALLYDKSEAELNQLFPERFVPLTEYTIKNTHQLYKNIHQDEANGFTYEQEEITRHARCIARPLRMNGTIVAALSVSFLVFNDSKEHIAFLKDALTKSANLIEKLMNARGFPYQ
ncbi:MAG: IclR family transcriptional regulator [Megasphaera sp.]|jgi:DNA-binding IclR family transcriptional regulator|nr:IclR family transcriptional regulator [Megasphaera sp.]MCH4188577.1 IclR family transcriptional regulator [Megasphaera sp.]MCH4218289.1 IclR family transcriptional regulator [Megasphaera sp.]